MTTPRKNVPKPETTYVTAEELRHLADICDTLDGIRELHGDSITLGDNIAAIDVNGEIVGWLAVKDGCWRYQAHDGS